MKLTTDILHKWFILFNDEYFGGELPVPRLALSKARTRLGTMSCKCTRRMFRRVYSDFTIRISTFYDCSEREYQETLLHEMIHYYITYRHIPDTSSHGRVFREMMQRINSRHGWHITVSATHRLQPACQAATPVTYVVLAIVKDDGTRMFSVVNPKAARGIDIQAHSVKEIADHRWYMTQDQYFSDFPKVRTLRARRVTAAIYDEKTAAMQPLALKL